VASGIFEKGGRYVCTSWQKVHYNMCYKHECTHTHTSTLPRRKEKSINLYILFFFEMFLTFFSGRIVDLKEGSGG